MKKRIMSVLLVVAMMFSLVACTPNMKSYSKELQKVSEWEAYTMEAKANMEVETQDSELNPVKFNMPMTITGKAKGQDLVEMNLKMDLKNMKKMAVETGEEIPATVPDEVDMKIFATSEKVYIGKKFFTDMLGEQAPEELKNLKEEYLAIEIGAGAMDGINAPDIDKAQIEAVSKYMQSKEFEAELLNLVEKGFKDFKPTVDMKVTGNTYTYEATIDELVKDFNLAAASFVKNSKEVEEPLSKILTNFGMPMTKEDLQEFVKEYNKDEFENSTKEMAELFKGSKISTQTTFEKNSYKQNMKMTINLSDFVKMNMTMETVSKKVDNVEIKLPTSAKEITMMEYFTMLGGVNPEVEMEPMVFVRINGKEVAFDSQVPTIKDNRTLVPFRGMLEEIGAEVKWDEKAQKVSAKKDDMNIELTIGSNKAKVNGKEVSLDVPATIENGRTMIPLRFVSENLGYKVKFDNENYPIYIIDVYNVTEEKLLELIEKEEQAIEEAYEKEFAEEKALDAAVDATDAATDTTKTEEKTEVAA